ncbi:DUF2160 family membrane protein, partial [Caballeronia glebae]|uniref:DUF2160 family membrane protein n=1 Tax=Caballeronia glebae TaxID=1777143 RepID=UPI000ADDA9FA
DHIAHANDNGLQLLARYGQNECELATTRGDRLFIGLLTAAYVNLAWLAISAEGSSSWPGFAASVLIVLAIMWKG